MKHAMQNRKNTFRTSGLSAGLFLSFALGLITALVGLTGCGSKSSESQISNETGSGTVVAGTKPAEAIATAKPSNGDPYSIIINKDLGSLIKTNTLQSAEVLDQLRLAGRLELNGYKTARIGAPVTGRISEIRALIGQEVRQGEPLAEINSQELTAAQLAFLKAHSAEQLATRAVERAELLLASDVIGSAELQRRQNELVVARSEKRASADQLRVLGISVKSVEQLESTGKLISAVPISATQTGTVIERKIAIGQVVQPADALFVVSDLRTLWASADIPEQDAGLVKRGQKVEIEIPALGNTRRKGSIIFVADVVNPETRTVRVGVDLDNPEKQLKPQMLISMLIDGKSQQKIVVPAAAVVRENDQDYLFVEQSSGVFKLTRVKLGPEKGGLRPFLEPLAGDRSVVIDGAFHLNNERLKRNLEKSERPA
jgi:membrane fusion protein, heavy metal efflux system